MISMSRTGGALKGQSFSGTFVNASKSVKFYAGTAHLSTQQLPEQLSEQGSHGWLLIPFSGPT